MAKNLQQFQDFLRDRVNLNPKRLERLETSVAAVNAYLKANLAGYQRMERQGSYAMETIIRPVDDNDEYDADIQIVMNPNSFQNPSSFIEATRSTLKDNKTYADKLRLKTRCVTVNYAGDFHLDVVPRVTLGGKHHICNRIDNSLEETDGDGYREWFNEKNRLAGGNLKRVVRLLKFLRDHKNNYTVKSILLTTLAGSMMRPSDKGSEAVRTVADTLVTVLTRLDAFLQGHPAMPQILNPVLPIETFNRHWDQAKYANFRNRVHAHTKTAINAMAETSHGAAIGIWQQLFGEEFGKGSSGGDGGGGSGPPGKPQGGPSGTIAAAIPVARRPGEARRFG